MEKKKNKENDLKINEFLKKDQKENDSYKKKNRQSRFNRCIIGITEKENQNGRKEVIFRIQILKSFWKLNRIQVYIFKGYHIYLEK